MPRRPSGDPRLKTRSWQAIVARWNQLQPQRCESPRCKAPTVPIQYGGRRGPYHLDVGHKVDRKHDDRTTWTIEDTRPEHATCNRAGGADITNGRDGLTGEPPTARYW